MAYYYGFDALGSYHSYTVKHAKFGELEAITELHGTDGIARALFGSACADYATLDGSMLGSFWSDLSGESLGGREIKVKDKLKYIAKLIIDGSKHPEVVLKAREIVHGQPDKDTTREIKAVWSWLKKNVRYVMDPDGQEVIGKAYRYVTADKAKRVNSGDCDEFAVVGGAMLKALGHPVRMVLWRRETGDWQHIFLVAWSKKDRAWVVVDPTEKDKPFGWHLTNGRFMVIPLPDEKAGLPETQLGSWLSSAFKKVKKVAKKAWDGVKEVATKVADKVKEVLPSAAGALASMIPGVGPMLAPMAGELVNGLVNNGKPNAAMEQMNQAIASGKSGSELLSTVANQGISAVTGPVIERVQHLVPQITQIADQYMPMIQQFLPQGVTNTINDARQWMQQLPAQMQQGVQQFSDHVQQSIAVPATAQVLYNTQQGRQMAQTPEQLYPYAQHALYSPSAQQQYPQYQTQQNYDPQQFELQRRANAMQNMRQGAQQSFNPYPGYPAQQQYPSYPQSGPTGPTGPGGIATPTAADYQALERGRQFAAQQQAQRQQALRQFQQPQQQMIPANQGFDPNFNPMQFNPLFKPRGESHQSMQQQMIPANQGFDPNFNPMQFNPQMSPMPQSQPMQQANTLNFTTMPYSVMDQPQAMQPQAMQYPMVSQQQLQQQRMAQSQGGVNAFALQNIRNQANAAFNQQQYRR